MRPFVGIGQIFSVLYFLLFLVIMPVAMSIWRVLQLF